jgi:hypothetical protein
MLIGKRTIVFFLIVIFILLKISRSANASTPGFALNYEAMRFRLAAERYIDTVNTLKETLQICEALFPIQMQAEIKKKGVDVNSEKIYKQMLAMRSSGEVFEWYKEFLSENETLREILNRTFVHADSADARNKTIYKLGKIEFYIRWFWLYPTNEGLMLVVQDEIKPETAEKMEAEIQKLRSVFELRFPMSEGLRRSPFWRKGVDKIFRLFPSARFTEDPMELIFTVFPSGSHIPAIIRQSVGLSN